MIKAPQTYSIQSLKLDTLYYVNYSICDAYIYKPEKRYIFVLHIYKDGNHYLYKECIDSRTEDIVDYIISGEKYNKIVDQYFSEVIMEDLL